ncbi:MAG: hypothetical protein CME75_04545 [Halomonas sp.]|nr:hypothetical protein [Halomonas sp.]
MATHTISLYSLSALNYKDRREAEGRLAKLDNVNGIDIIDVFKDFLTANKIDHLHRDEIDKSVFAVESFEVCSSGRCIYGIINAGRYGVPSKIRDSKTGSHKYSKGASDADVTDRFFIFFAPSEKDEAIIALHNVQGHGVKTVLAKGLKEAYRDRTRLNLNFNGLSYDNAAQKWLDAQVKEIVATQYKAPTDLTDELATLGHAHSDLVLKPKRKKTFGILRRFKDEKPKAISLLEEQSDKVKAVVQVNGRRRTFQISGNAGVPVMTLELDDNLYRLDGAIDFIKMKEWSAQVINELCQSMYHDEDGQFICLKS